MKERYKIGEAVFAKVIVGEDADNSNLWEEGVVKEIDYRKGYPSYYVHFVSGLVKGFTLDRTDDYIVPLIIDFSELVSI